MTSKIIALIDGSTYSQSVCDNAAWIARRTDAAVELVHVLGRRETASADLSGTISLGARSALLAELSALDETRARLAQKRGRAILEDAQATLAEAGVTATMRLRNGDLLEAVAEAEKQAGLIVIGKRGEGADFARLHLGSNLERIARSATRPVYVAARAWRPVAKVLIAHDGGPSIGRAIDHIAASPLLAGLDIHLLRVGADTAENRRGIEAARAALEAAGHTAAAELAPGQPDKVIAERVERDGIDLLVMGAYGHSRIRSMIIGSTTSEMIRACKIPVFLFR
ncbi:universal stress protein [Nitratireductor mangrovi]|uniref:Universal stress protein n=1 Tax=Nitratireductor mangrovi TaxID=2599600 RepID=A0A5B8L1D0_9HYPH|nr:universal stress protein [Nitratireductor mangrovi]QDZ01711.1 universal stress protein [Nitratireductor mangrovi]